MARLKRTTGPVLDVAVCLLRAHVAGQEVHGWAVMRETNRSGPTVYEVLDRFEDRGWIAGQWEELDQESDKPRRRFYKLTPGGVAGLRDVVATQRSKAFQGLVNCPHGVPGWRPLAPGGPA